jgi:hypothetical protein
MRTNNRPPNRELDRVLYWEGQMLRSGDFLDIQRVEAERRWWHNRAMHNAFGVYLGLQISENQDVPNAIQITPGVAYDCAGRELLLECAATILYPLRELAAKEIRVLVMRHKRPATRRTTDAIAAVCCFCDGRSSSGNIAFVWVDEKRINVEDGVPLGVIRSVGTRRSFFQYVLRQRRALARPLVATGSTIPGNTAWQPWEYAPPSPLQAVELHLQETTSLEIGVQTTIDTSAAGFTVVPQYFAWLEGPIFNSHTWQLVPALLPSIANEALDSFTFRLVLLQEEQPGEVILLAHTIAPKLRLIQTPDDFGDFARDQELYVSWLGCQMPAAGSTPQQQIVCKTKITAGYEGRKG